MRGGIIAATLSAVALTTALPANGSASARSAEAHLPAAAEAPASVAELAGDIPDLRTRTTLTYHALHGSYETHAYAESVNYRDATGEWQRIDNALRPRGDAVTNGANRYRVTLPAELDSGAVRIAEGSAWVEFEPRGARPTPIETRGSAASFRNAWPGVRLEYTATGDTVKEAIVVRGPGYARDFVFDMRLAAGMNPKQLASGAILLQEHTGSAAMTIAPSQMVDAAGAYAPVPTELRRDIGGWTLRIKPDRAWLHDADRRWPVTIDPTVNVDPALACQIYRLGTGESGGSCATPLLIGESYYCGVETTTPGYWCEAYRALVRFNVTGALPPGAVVEHASIETNSQSPNGPQLYEVTASWTDDVSWNTRDGATPWTSGCCTIAGGAEYDRIGVQDLTEVVTAWATGARPNHGLLFTAPWTFASSDNFIIEPVLTIQYSPTDDPDGVVQNTAADEYVASEGISRAEALRRLRLQDRLRNLAEELEAAIAAADFGGTWFDDPSGGRIKIAIKSAQSPPPSSKTAAARALLEDHALDDNSDFVSVADNIGDLESESDDLADQFEALLVADKLHIGVDVSRNAVIAEKANSLTASENAALDAAAAAASVSVIVHLTNDPTLGIELSQDCGREDPPHVGWTSPPHPQYIEDEMARSVFVCDDPYRAGVGLLGWRMQDGFLHGSLCTGGFLARNNPPNGSLYVMTAGHCMGQRVDDPPSVWKSYDGDFTGHQRNIGDPARWDNVPIDAGVVRIDPSSVYAQGDTPGWVWVSNSQHTTYDEQYEIQGLPRVTRSLLGTRLCWSSAVRMSNENSNRTNCGKVSQIHDKARGRRRLIQVNNCSPGGSSGGPLYKRNNGYGILVVGKRSGTFWNPCRTWFTEARVAQDQLNVNVVFSTPVP